MKNDARKKTKKHKNCSINFQNISQFIVNDLVYKKYISIYNFQ